MQTEADIIIDGLGGTSAVSAMTDTPTSTVHSWRSKGLTRSRRNHLKLAAKENGIPWPIAEDCPAAVPLSTGQIGEMSRQPAGVSA